MEWAPDVRYCEVFLDHEYQGLYVMAEQISMGEGRIEMTKYDGKSNISSYIVCADRESVNDVQYLSLMKTDLMIRVRYVRCWH